MGFGKHLYIRDLFHRLKQAFDARVFGPVHQHQPRTHGGGPRDIVSNHPHWAQGVIRLHHDLQAANDALEAMSDRLNRDPYLVESSHQIVNFITSIRSVAEILEEFPDLPEKTRNDMAAGLSSESRKLGKAAKSLFEFISDPGKTPRPTTPAERVNDFLIDRMNYFHELELLAEELRHRVASKEQRINDALFDYLAHRHQIEVHFCAPQAASTPGSAAYYRFDRKRRNLHLANTLPEASVRFQLVQLIVELDAMEQINAIIRAADLPDETHKGVRRALVSYAAGAFLFPYKAFLKACQQTRYDIQMLRRRFGGSYEQICHRFITLRRDGAAGTPFAFLRVDPAGNISKRYSLPSLPLPRAGGGCPLLPAYQAFLKPGQITAQIGALPEGATSLYVARTVSKHVGAFGEPDRVYSVMIACDLHDIERVVYGDRLSVHDKRHITPVGVHCRTCARQNCQHRAFRSVLENG